MHRASRFFRKDGGRDRALIVSVVGNPSLHFGLGLAFDDANGEVVGVERKNRQCWPLMIGGDDGATCVIDASVRGVEVKNGVAGVFCRVTRGWGDCVQDYKVDRFDKENLAGVNETGATVFAPAFAFVMAEG